MEVNQNLLFDLLLTVR